MNDKIYDSSKENFTVAKSVDPSAFKKLRVRSEYKPLSGRQVMYCAEKAYADCQQGCSWGVDIQDVMYVIWQCGDHTIEYFPQKSFSAELLQFWFLHTILPMVLTLEKRYDILHVGAVEVNGEPIIFSAESFGGKSTLTDFFIQQGHTMLSDDTLGVYRDDQQYMAVPSYPYHRPFREAECLGHKITNVTKGPKPLKAVYLLERAESDAAVAIEEVSGIEKFTAFHFSSFINFDFFKAYRFKTVSEMATKIPVFRVTVPWDKMRLQEVHCAIVAHTSARRKACL